jgi:hypothetical protein
MSTLRRCLLILVSIGWIAPLSLVFWAEHGFIFNVIWPWISRDVHWGGSFHPVDYAPRFFYFSMAWLAVVITCWVWRLTRTDASR